MAYIDAAGIIGSVPHQLDGKIVVMLPVNLPRCPIPPPPGCEYVTPMGGHIKYNRGSGAVGVCQYDTYPARTRLTHPSYVSGCSSLCVVMQRVLLNGPTIWAAAALARHVARLNNDSSAPDRLPHEAARKGGHQIQRHHHPATQLYPPLARTAADPATRGHVFTLTSRLGRFTRRNSRKG